MIRCKICRNQDSDTAYWINWKKFIHDAGPDHEYGLAKTIHDCYCIKWFEPSDQPVRLFIPSPFHLRNGVASFIDGRHRFAVLSQYQSLVPMSLTKPVLEPELDDASTQVLNGIIEGIITDNDEFELPDLPIQDEAWFKAR